MNTNGSSASIPLLSSITYNVDHSPTGWLWSDGKPRSIGHDANGFVSSYTLGDPTGTGNAAGVLRTVQRDAAARITGYTHTGSGATGLDQTFAYDNLNRLTAATQGTASTSYSYDATGNRTQKTVAGIGYPNTVATTSNRLTQVSTPAGTASIGHDAAGNVTADGSATFSYSDRGRMASATTSAGTVNYLYDGRNQRVKKSGPSSLVNTGEAYYVYDEAGQLLGEYDANGNPLYETIYLGSTPVGAMKQAGSAAGNDLTTSLYNVYADHIDTPRVITRQDHTIVWRWDTAEAFGSTAPNQNPSGLGTFVFNQRFPGQVFDQETGLNQNWNRDYDAWIGRYRQSDPIGLAGGINTFGYVGANPLSKTDRLGLLEDFTFDRRAGTLTHDCSCSAKLSTPAFSGNHQFTNRPEFEDVENHGPIPGGTYYIVEPYHYNRVNGQVFFKLYRDDEEIDDYTTLPNGKKRGQFRFHPGTASNGCVTVSDRKHAAQWNRIQDLLLSTKTGTIPGTGITYYGTVKVK